MELEKLKFMTKVNQASGRKVREMDECWFWTGCSDKGYGQYQTNYAKSSGCMKAHQMSYHLFKDSTFKPSRATPIRHLCEAQDNHAHRGCVNPAHLVVGTIAENIADRDANLGVYQLKGEDVGTAKFSLEEAKKIQESHLAGKEYKEIAAELNVNRRTVERICTGKTYGLPDCRSILEQRKREKLEALDKMLDEHASYKEIKEKLGVSFPAISARKKLRT